MSIKRNSTLKYKKIFKLKNGRYFHFEIVSVTDFKIETKEKKKKTKF